MLSAGWVVVLVVAAILLTWWVTFTITRLDRLHARIDAAQAAMDAQFVRRAAALALAAEHVPPPLSDQLSAAAHGALNALEFQREQAENDVSRAIAAMAASQAAVPPAVLGELNEASARSAIARRFYNDAVRDTRSLRARRLPRALRLAGRRALPQFLDIEDAPALSAAASVTPPAHPARPEPADRTPGETAHA